MERFVIKKDGVEWFSTPNKDTMMYLISKTVKQFVNARHEDSLFAVQSAEDFGHCVLNDTMTLYYYEGVFVVKPELQIGATVFPIRQDRDSDCVVIRTRWYVGEEDEIDEIRPQINKYEKGHVDTGSIFYKLRNCGRTLPTSVLFKTEQDAFDYLKIHNMDMDEEWLAKRNQEVAK
jgi:hypothetical protein